MNSGGRKRFVKNSKVRILQLAGDVSSEIFIVIDPSKDGIPKNEASKTEEYGEFEEYEEGEPEDNEYEYEYEKPKTANKQNKVEYVRADRKGHIIVKPEGGTKEQKVHFRRVLPVEIDGQALVIESNDKYRAVCPKCGCVENVDPSDTAINCPKCGKIQVHWLGVKPMVETTAAEKSEAKPAAKKPATAKPAAKKEKAVREVIKVDFNALKSLTSCELWTKGHVKFDHPDVDVQAHVLIFADGDKSRKLCFNTYDGALGKKSPPLPISEFTTNGTVTTGKREKPWFAVKNLDKAKTKLAKDGYEQQ